MAAIVFGAVGLQAFWITRELDGIKVSLARIEGAVLTLDRRVTRLEQPV
jgi:hypothetical protein